MCTKENTEAYCDVKTPLKFVQYIWLYRKINSALNVRKKPIQKCEYMRTYLTRNSIKTQKSR